MEIFDGLNRDLRLTETEKYYGFGIKSLAFVGDIIVYKFDGERKKRALVHAVSFIITSPLSSGKFAWLSYIVNVGTSVPESTVVKVIRNKKKRKEFGFEIRN